MAPAKNVLIKQTSSQQSGLADTAKKRLFFHSSVKSWRVRVEKIWSSILAGTQIVQTAGQATHIIVGDGATLEVPALLQQKHAMSSSTATAAAANACAPTAPVLVVSEAWLNDSKLQNWLLSVESYTIQSFDPPQQHLALNVSHRALPSGPLVASSTARPQGQPVAMLESQSQPSAQHNRSADVDPVVQMTSTLSMVPEMPQAKRQRFQEVPPLSLHSRSDPLLSHARANTDSASVLDLQQGPRVCASSASSPSSPLSAQASQEAHWSIQPATSNPTATQTGCSARAASATPSITNVGIYHITAHAAAQQPGSVPFASSSGRRPDVPPPSVALLTPQQADKQAMAMIEPAKYAWAQALHRHNLRHLHAASQCLADPACKHEAQPDHGCGSQGRAAAGSEFTLAAAFPKQLAAATALPDDHDQCSTAQPECLRFASPSCPIPHLYTPLDRTYIPSTMQTIQIGCRTAAVAAGNAHAAPTTATAAAAALANIKVVTYNVLAHMFNIRAKATRGIPLGICDWKFRGCKVLAELQHYDADIYCLQETDSWPLNTIRAWGYLRGYRCVWYFRQADYTVLLYKHVRFRLLAQRAKPLAESITGEGLFWASVAKSHEGAAMALLQLRSQPLDLQTSNLDSIRSVGHRLEDVGAVEDGPILCAVSTHLKHDSGAWSANAHAVRTAQSHLLCAGITTFLRDCARQGLVSSSDPADIPLILGGDFNCTWPCPTAVPTAAKKVVLSQHKRGAGVYTLLTTGLLCPSHPDHPGHLSKQLMQAAGFRSSLSNSPRVGFSRSQPAACAGSSSGNGNPFAARRALLSGGDDWAQQLSQLTFGSHGMRLRSVHVAAHGREPRATHCSEMCGQTFDYIFVSPHFGVSHTLSMPYDETKGRPLSILTPSQLPQEQQHEQLSTHSCSSKSSTGLLPPPQQQHHGTRDSPPSFDNIRAGDTDSDDSDADLGGVGSGEDEDDSLLRTIDGGKKGEEGERILVLCREGKGGAMEYVPLGPQYCTPQALGLTRLPNEVWPSDHLAVGCILQL